MITTITNLPRAPWHLTTDRGIYDGCPAKHPNGWRCTRVNEHDGPHVAMAGTAWCAAWVEYDPDYIMDKGL